MLACYDPTLASHPIELRSSGTPVSLGWGTRNISSSVKML